MFRSPEIVTNWDNLSTFCKFLLKSITYSDFDRPERGPICVYSDVLGYPVQSSDSYCPEVTLQSHFYVQTRKGIVFCPDLT